jgi:hypothetical protein
MKVASDFGKSIFEMLSAAELFERFPLNRDFPGHGILFAQARDSLLAEIFQCHSVTGGAKGTISPRRTGEA